MQLQDFFFATSSCLRLHRESRGQSKKKWKQRQNQAFSGDHSRTKREQGRSLTRKRRGDAACCLAFSLTMSSHNSNVNAVPGELASPTPLSPSTMGNGIITDGAPSAIAVAAAGGIQARVRPSIERMVSRMPSPAPPASAPPMGKEQSSEMVLDLADGTSYTGISFGAEGKSVSGECVFQTGENGHFPVACTMM